MWAIEAIEAIEAIMDYNPEPDLDKIMAKVLLINAEEDEANPPELGTVERAMKRVRHGRYVLSGERENARALHPFLRGGLEALFDRVLENPSRRDEPRCCTPFAVGLELKDRGIMGMLDGREAMVT